MRSSRDKVEGTTLCAGDVTVDDDILGVIRICFGLTDFCVGKWLSALDECVFSSTGLYDVRGHYNDVFSATRVSVEKKY